METETETTPRAWIGCLACYNNGRLRGKWIDAETAAAEYAADVITYAGQATPGTYPSGTPAIYCDACHGDEFDVFDHENLPKCCRTVRGFYENAERLAEMDADTLERFEVLAGWLGGEMSLDDLTAYDEDNYRGQWDTFREYAEQYADEVGDMTEATDHLRGFIDWQAYADWLEQDYYHDNSTGHTWLSV